jgi:hypothetical protein
MFRALSIDGGGMRGIYTAAYLDALDTAYSQRRQIPGGLDIGKGFQVIVGTSTGAIIGCALAIGTAPAKVVELYRTHGAEVFPKKLPSILGCDLLMQLVTRPAYLEKGERALRSELEKLLHTATLADIWNTRHIALAMTAVNMSTYRSWVFKTPHDSCSNHRDDERTLVEVCLASSAAPLYRSLAVLEHEATKTYNVFADGGLWANNPVIVTLVEALQMASHTEEDIEIFSLGSCGKPEGEIIPREERHRSLTEWKLGGGAAAVSIAAQEFTFDMIAKFLCPHLKKNVRIIRFPSEKIPAAMLEYLDLDETRREGLDALVQQARADADMTNSKDYQGTDGARAIGDVFNAMPPRAV